MDTRAILFFVSYSYSLFLSSKNQAKEGGFMEKTLEILSLEQRLLKRKIIRLAAIAVLAILLFVAGTVCYSIREESREVVTHQVGYHTWETVTYDDSLIPLIALSIGGGIVAIFYIFLDFMICRYETLSVNGHFLTVYRGPGAAVVYVDGEERGRLGVFEWASPVVEARLPDGVKATVTFGRTPWVMAHVSYSDNNPSVEI